MAEYESGLGGMLMEGLVAFRPVVSPTEATREFAALVGQYVEALVDACVTHEELARALRNIRRTRTDRFWPTIAEVLQATRQAREMIRLEARPPSVRALPAPQAAPVMSDHDRALMGKKMQLLASGLAAGNLRPLHEINAEAARLVAEEAA